MGPGSKVRQIAIYFFKAMDIVLRGMSSAFDLSKEDPRIIEQYDTSHIKPDAGVQKRNSYAIEKP